MCLNRRQQPVGELARLVERGVIHRRDALADFIQQITQLRACVELLSGRLFRRKVVHFVDAIRALVQLLVLVDLLALHVHRREQIRGRPVREDRRNHVLHFVGVRDALLRHLRQQHLFEPFERRRLEQIAAEQRARLDPLDHADFVVLDVLLVEQPELHHLLCGPHGRLALVDVAVCGHEPGADLVPAHFLNQRLHLVIERVLAHLLCRNAARLDEVAPLVAANAAARRRQHLLYHVRFVPERRFVLRAAAQLDDLQHVHELLFVRVRVFRAEHRLVRELHFRERRHHHLRVVLVRKDRQRVAHQRHVVRRAYAHHLHRAHVLLGVLCRLVAEA
ncbi:hypothetical protein Y026_6263 [Burkholderia pseudomallei TSV28]|nr:hypothetical protein Y026_6263 [Burkholderia pseudomallei TSV28]